MKANKRKLWLQIAIGLNLLKLWMYSIGQFIPIEIDDQALRMNVYKSIELSSMLSILLSLIYTLKISKGGERKCFMIVATLLAAFVSFCFSFWYSTYVRYEKYGVEIAPWKETWIYYQSITNPRHRVAEQVLLNQGFDCSNWRTVEVAPLIGPFAWVIKADTNAFIKSGWQRLDSSLTSKNERQPMTSMHLD